MFPRLHFAESARRFSPVRMNKQLLLALWLAPTLAFSQPGSAPRANITNYEAPGSLAATQQLPCIDLADARPTMTPPDLHTAVRACIQAREFDRAARLFVLAGVYARFDAKRVADPSAHGAGRALIIQTTSAFSASDRERLAAGVKRLAGEDRRQQQAFCAQVRQLGVPQYLPRYMIQHGVDALSARASPQNALVAPFDADAVWSHLQSSYMRCPTP
ncbi:hypothetical protein [Ramlibacter rhizophilus]|uniref:Uncharacterized protein n=1 Tax=Ramlibacter rhizophilus TaxID=1781167 RepID=A0A4Z0C1W7_9BURK|nr:hypothetical protein [Ramlibacter rhizophilus]TFZ04219.1 hypothetical protein EZ242_00180 [Ramlibacter rhizophilus]